MPEKRIKMDFSEYETIMLENKTAKKKLAEAIQVVADYRKEIGEKLLIVGAKRLLPYRDRMRHAIARSFPNSPSVEVLEQEIKWLERQIKERQEFEGLDLDTRHELHGEISALRVIAAEKIAIDKKLLEAEEKNSKFWKEPLLKRLWCALKGSYNAG